MKTLFVLALLLIGQAAPAADTQTPQAFSGEVTLKVGYRYLLSLPDGYEKAADKTWPLIVFLHGAGERGDDLELLKKHGPPKLLAAGKKFGAIIASLQCEPKQIWNPHGVKAVTDHLAATLRVDRDRIYLTGLSLGGFGTWETAMEYPQTYAAIAPICGGAGVRWTMAERIKHLPAWIFHGDADKAVPVENSNKIHDALKKVGAPVKLTIYPGVAHDSWTTTYDNPEFWEWLLAQKRAAP
ncbi:MAG: prolyl oligopeptidase family serine peptidase [Prosthecobacter sp.]|nr:prolyl oligopeptidase family serine peptidase [Prosthecobacter sp.]